MRTFAIPVSKSQPSRSTRFISKPLQNLTVATLQEPSAFVGTEAAPFVKVEQSEGKYFILPPGQYNTLSMARRAPSTESEGSGWTYSNDSYKCERYATHHDEDWSDLADEDPALNSDAEGAEWLANQGRIFLDFSWQAVCMQPATWTTDYDGVSGVPGANEIKQWNESGSTPQADVETLKEAIEDLIGRLPNTMVVGRSVHKRLLTHAIVRDAIKYTEQTTMKNIDVNAKMAAFFGVERYLVARAFRNTANEGQTASLGKIVNSLDMWLGYVNPSPGKRKLSAAYTFAWTGPQGVGSDGVVTRKFDIETKTTTRREIETFWDVKVISADAGAFVDDCVAS